MYKQKKKKDNESELDFKKSRMINIRHQIQHSVQHVQNFKYRKQHMLHDEFV